MRRRKKYDIYIVIGLALITIGNFTYNKFSSEDRGIKNYSAALKEYKNSDYEKAYQIFGKVPSGSTLKTSALFRQARCATNMNKKELAVKKYNKIVHSNSKTSIVPISEYNMANLLFEIDERDAQRHFKRIIKKYPTSDYAIASEYFLGLIDSKKYSEHISNSSSSYSEKQAKKLKEQAIIHFKNYIEKAPDGRYSIKSIEELNKLKPQLNNYDNLLIAKSYYKNGEYEKAKQHLNKTTLAESWADFAKNEFKLGNSEKGVYYTETGLIKHADATSQEDVFEAIDSYVASFPSRKDGITKLASLGLKSTGADYAMYLNCSEVVENSHKDACYRTLYEKYPNGQFSADSLYNLFLAKYLQRKYQDAQRLGFLHLKKFPNVKSSPAVTYYMGRIAYKLKHYDNANAYYKQVLHKYPDSYYAYRAHYNLYKDDGALPFLEIMPKPVVFPYKKSLDNDLVVRLAHLKDYDLVDELCKKDKFIQSWIAYEKENYAISAVLARKAMEELPVKPPFNDLRWRLVYPAHYYDIVDRVKGNNNPIVLESIIKEESHFNPYARSAVGAIGLMQLMPATYNEVVTRHNLPANLNIEATNITAGSLYYESLKKVLGNKDLYAISAYNGGIGSVTNWFSKLIYNDTDEFVEQIPYPETKNYVKKVLRTYWVYGNIY